MNQYCDCGKLPTHTHHLHTESDKEPMSKADWDDLNAQPYTPKEPEYFRAPDSWKADFKKARFEDIGEQLDFIHSLLERERQIIIEGIRDDMEKQFYPLQMSNPSVERLDFRDRMLTLFNSLLK